MGHEYCGIVEEVGSAVTTIRPGQFVVGSSFASDNTCEICRSGYQPACPHKEAFGPTGASQAERMRVPLADGTLVATPEVPDADLVPHFLATSDVLGTGWFAAVAATPARARPSPSSATAPSDSWACWPRRSSVRNASSR
jgi:threonine dehydrogenase-like Zn-dependent dehydrogenase